MECVWFAVRQRHLVKLLMKHASPWHWSKAQAAPIALARPLLLLLHCLPAFCSSPRLPYSSPNTTPHKRGIPARLIALLLGALLFVIGFAFVGLLLKVPRVGQG